METEMRNLNECTWKLTGAAWQTGCGHSICDDSTSHDWAFCPWCGKEILEVDESDQAI